MSRQLKVYMLTGMLILFPFIGKDAMSAESADDIAANTAYRSPYGVALPCSADELIPDILSGERGDPRRESETPYELWYDHSKTGAWGPFPRAYMPASIVGNKDAAFRRARVIAAAMRFEGYAYRHHHIPDWDPPAGWHTPKPGGVRHDGKGVDCSNFTSFVYNQALGIRFSSDIQEQAVMTSAVINGSESALNVTVIQRQETLAGWKKALRPGDLIFIRPENEDGISHVIIWIGEWGTAPGGTSLVLDSHGADTRDADGTIIPDGIHLRPFTEKSWYFMCADHAVRIIED